MQNRLLPIGSHNSPGLNHVIALKTINEVKFDAIELRPYYHAIEFLPTFKKAWDGEYYVAGFVNTEEKLKKCKEAGFSGAMTSTVELWNKKFEK